MLELDNQMQRFRLGIARSFLEAIRTETRSGGAKPYGLAKAVSRFTPGAAIHLEQIIRMIFERLDTGDDPRCRQVLELRLRGHSRQAVAAILRCQCSSIEFAMQVATVAADDVVKELAAQSTHSH